MSIAIKIARKFLEKKWHFFKKNQLLIKKLVFKKKLNFQHKLKIFKIKKVKNKKNKQLKF